MPKDKTKTVNPATAALKAQKAAALRKCKAQVAAQRSERLAHRNPERLQRQIDELKEAEAGGTPLKPRERQALEGLERDLRLVRKARESRGGEDAGKTRAEGRGERGGGGGGAGRGGSGAVLGKRGRDGEPRGVWRDGVGDAEQSSDSDDDARAIPMPTDVENEPPIPRRLRPGRRQNANETPVGENRMPHALPEKPVEKPVLKAQTVYEAKPQIRNLQKEAVARFVPAAVAAKRRLAQGQGRLLEPEEADRLEKGGYMGVHGGMKKAEQSSDRLREEEERFRREMEGLETADIGRLVAKPSDAANQSPRQVEMEEVDDEDYQISVSISDSF